MRQIHRNSALPLTLLGLAIAAPAKAELSLEPTSDWRLREYDDKCRMSRSFGSGENRLTLWVDKGGQGPGLNLTLIGRPVRSPYGPKISVTFAPGETVTRNYIKSKSSKGRPVLAMFGVQPISFEPETLTMSEADDQASDSKGEETVDLTAANISDVPSMEVIEARFDAITALNLKGGVIKPIPLQMTGFSQMMQPLMECANKLTARLSGLREDGRYSRGTPSLPKDMEEWSKKIAAYYPLHLLREGEQGSVGVRLTVNTKGRASYCEVVQYKGPASFNDTACLLLLRHARFEPARNAQGEPKASFYQTSVNYKISE